MFAQKELNQLAERKRLLILESALHRDLLALECARLRSRLAPLDNTLDRLGRLRPWLMAGSALAGLLAAKGWRKPLRWIPTAMTAWRWLRHLWPRSGCD